MDAGGIPPEVAAEREALYARAREMFGRKEYAQIVAMCEEAERVGKYDANIVAVHSASLLKLNRPNDVVALLEGMLYYFPNDARLHMNLGTAYAATFRRRESKDEYDLARRLDPLIVGQKVTRMSILRITLGAVSFAAFFAAIIFWPHTRWLLVGLVGAMICVSGFVVFGAIRGQTRQRLLAPILMLVFWVVLLFLAIFMPSRW